MPPSWPPGEYDRAAQEFFLARLEEAGPAGVGWYGWYAIQAADSERPATVVGGCGYHGPPTPAGVVEVGFSVCPEWRGQGFATEMAHALAARAAGLPGTTRVIAHTSEGNHASIAVLRRSGFVHVGPGADEGSLQFEWPVGGAVPEDSR